MRTAPKATLFITAIALAVGLAGCSGAGGQSVADACKIIQTEGQTIASEGQSAASSAATDPGAAVDALNKVQDEFEKIGSKITNDKVKPAFDSFVGAYGEMADIIGKVAKDPAAAADAMGDFQKVTTKVTDAGAELQKVCGG